MPILEDVILDNIKDVCKKYLEILYAKCKN